MGILSGILNVLLLITSVFLVCLVLIQRGKGGGLAGAFGGVGGSSAFGTKAGDVFTRITIATAAIWFLLAMLLVILSNQGRTSAASGLGTGPAVPLTSAADASKTPAPVKDAAKGTSAPKPAAPAKPAGPAEAVNP